MLKKCLYNNKILCNKLNCNDCIHKTKDGLNKQIIKDHVKLLDSLSYNSLLEMSVLSKQEIDDIYQIYKEKVILENL